MEVLLTIAVGGLIGQIIAMHINKKYFYDILSHYTIYNENLTETIDMMIMDKNHGKPGLCEVLSENKKIPAEGKHFYFIKHVRKTYLDNWSNYVGLDKIVEKIGQNPKTYYLVWTPPTDRKKVALDIFDMRLFGLNKDSIDTYQIDSTGMEPKLFRFVQNYYKPYPHQLTAIDRIISVYKYNKYNAKILIYGGKNIGKSTTAIQLKKELDSCYENTNAQIINAFDPSQTGLNILKLALSQMQQNAPVILIIDEIQTYYENVYAKEKPHVSMFQHTRNISTFNQLFDALGSIKYLFLIMTTNIDPKKLWETTNDEILKDETQIYSTFMRKGRIDGFIEMYYDDKKAKTKYFVNNNIDNKVFIYDNT